MNGLETIRALHEEWFPVRYSAGFYDAAVRERMVGTGESLFTLVAEDAETKEVVGVVTAQVRGGVVWEGCAASSCLFVVSPLCQRLVS